MSKQVSRGSAGEYQSDERAGVTRLRRASICISRPPAPPGSIWSSAGLRCSLNANCAGAYTPVSEPSRLSSGPILLTPTRTPCPSYGQRPPTKSWPVSPDFVSGLQRQDTSVLSLKFVALIRVAAPPLTCPLTHRRRGDGEGTTHWTDDMNL